METTTAAPVLTSGYMLMVSSARRNLRQVLNHPAFTKERRQKAEALISTSTDAAQLMKWKALAIAESEAWEDDQLKAEHEQPGPPAHPEYNY
jgi:hypothetical protein